MAFILSIRLCRRRIVEKRDNYYQWNQQNRGTHMSKFLKEDSRPIPKPTKLLVFDPQVSFIGSAGEREIPAWVTQSVLGWWRGLGTKSFLLHGGHQRNDHSAVCAAPRRAGNGSRADALKRT